MRPAAPSQPKQISEIKDFLLTARRKDAKCAPAPAAHSAAPRAFTVPLRSYTQLLALPDPAR